MVGSNSFPETHQQRCRVGEASPYVGLKVGQGVRRGDARRVQRFVAQLVAAADRDNRDVRRPGGGRDACGGLAVQGLLVHGAFAGHHEVDVRESAVKADQVEDDVDAGPKLGVEHGERAESDPASCACAGMVAQVRTRGDGDDVSEMC